MLSKLLTQTLLMGTFIMGDINHKCQVPTPHEIVVQMLDQVGYTQNLYGRRILENSCGAGGFLSEIVERYIRDCKAQHLTIDQIRQGLQRDVHGIEKDRKLHKQCVNNLELIAQKYGINRVHWNIKRRNALHATKSGKYQFVVGNPPYLAYPELDSDTREFMRKNFVSCQKGKPDYYYAFIEIALNALANDGKLIYLVPGNFMKNYYSEGLRQLILPSLYEITDYSHHRLFDKVLTSSVIIHCDRTRTIPTVRYEDRHYGRIYIMPKVQMRGKWIFDEKVTDGLVRFSDYFHASAPVATQLNRAFVINNWDEDNELGVRKGNILIEHTILRNAAGPKALQRQVQERIIFPYSYDKEGRVVRFTETQFHTNYSGAYEYLHLCYEELKKRKADSNAKWFEYGRAQLLLHLNQPKLVLSSFITQQPRIYIIDQDTVPYAGICVVAKQGFTVEQAQSVLNSGAFMDYVRRVGVCTNGISYRISPTDINSFFFSRELLEG